MPKSGKPKAVLKVKDLAPKSADTKAAKGGGVGPCWRTRK